MKRMLQIMMVLATGLMAAAVGCEERKTTTQTEVKDKLFGGKEVETTEVIEQGDKVQVRETETDINDDGEVTKKEIEIKGDSLD
jgi:hypothetical protein